MPFAKTSARFQHFLYYLDSECRRWAEDFVKKGLFVSRELGWADNQLFAPQSMWDMCLEPNGKRKPSDNLQPEA